MRKWKLSTRFKKDKISLHEPGTARDVLLRRGEFVVGEHWAVYHPRFLEEVIEQSIVEPVEPKVAESPVEAAPVLETPAPEESVALPVEVPPEHVPEAGSVEPVADLPIVEPVAVESVTETQVEPKVEAPVIPVLPSLAPVELELDTSVIKEKRRVRRGE